MERCTKKGKDDNHEDLRALLNAGYKRGASVPRCVGPRHDVVNFNVFAAVALAGLGDLPDTVMSRSLIIRMRRRSPTESVEPFRTREHEPLGRQLRDFLARWAGQVAADVADAWPDLPAGIVDRPAEVWEPLLAVADAAGGDWPALARTACVELCRAAEDRRVSLGVRLLADMKTIFGDAEALHTDTIIERLCAGDAYGLAADAPWAELHGRPLSVRGLASLLRPYAVTPVKVKASGRSLQGYRRAALWDAWSRYLPSSPAQAEPAEPVEPRGGNGGLGVPEVPEVPDTRDSKSAPGLIVCATCAHFESRPDAQAGGWCRRYEEEVSSSVPFHCPKYEFAAKR